jgi:hypothetical protein
MASDASSESASTESSHESYRLVSAWVTVEDLKFPDRWMKQNGIGDTREPYPLEQRNYAPNMGMPVEAFVDTCRAIATSIEINDAVSQSVIRVVERQFRLFPSNLHLNNKGDEPPRLFMSS